jgi:ATP-dependent helicase Lhr and Lhr-like helicase
MTIAKLHPRLQDFVKNNWRGGLSEIQELAFSSIFDGQNCTVEAPTSGGKTEAVLFPLLTRISNSQTSGFKVLYIAPLKALLNDLALRILPYTKMCYMEAFKWHGDVSQADKIEQMVFPSDVLMTTPESLEAILLRKANWQEVFSNLETIVIDEAHYFALTERGSHLLSLLERIQADIGHTIQRIAVTATIGNPEGLLLWLLGTEKEGQCFKVSSKTDKERNFKIHYFLPDSARLSDFLYDLLVNKKSIVFERSRSRTEQTAMLINERNLKIQSRFPVRVKTHHSSVSKQLREDAESSIKMTAETSIDAIISTSTLELGIDIGDLDQIIQIGGLSSSGSFLQRVGRTGRRPGRPQFFRGLCDDEDELILLTGCVSLGWKRISENILFPTRAFHILTHQIICLSLQKRGVTADQAWEILSRPFCFSKISRKDLDDLISFMVHEDFLRLLDGQIILPGEKTEKEFLRSNYRRLFAIFDSGPAYNVVDGKKVIGTLDSDFARSQELPFVFVLGGQEWNTLKIDHEMQQISVKKNATGIAPEWKSISGFDIPFELAQEVGEILVNNVEPKFLDDQALLRVKAQQETYNQLGWGLNKWILESSIENGDVFLWTFCGDKINRALSLLFSNGERHSKYDYKKVVFKSDGKNSNLLNDISHWLSELKSSQIDELETLAEQQVKVSWFSKFSACLPDALARKTIFEKSLDMAGMFKASKTATIEVYN